MINKKYNTPQDLLKMFNKGERLNLAQLKFLNKNLWKEIKEAKDPEKALKFREKADEVQEEIEFWTEIEKTRPFASFEKYTR